VRFEDKIIANEIRKGNREVFKAAYNEYYQNLVSFASGYLHDSFSSQDVVQSFFLGIWRNSKNFKIDTSLKAYFFGAIKNKCLNRLRDLNLRDERNLIYLETMLSLDIEFDEHDKEITDEVRIAIDSLPDQMKSILIKKYFDGMKTKEIAEQLLITQNTVNTQLKRGRSRLKEILVKSTKLHFIL
jgi:RNA polymerase sigma-70 factor (family 1)